ncbi:hypothetical protein PanWU01x14_020500 [Parasponia andersonii]|uniref:Uncharacterized protein n=1 Tax=Parasponia andersonii TaxID=3476 RepID=A0A2P5DYQ0_PARAD|nr:hypothetical protein PanWU01x14_020500 [Parasponia andersonii]
MEHHTPIFLGQDRRGPLSFSGIWRDHYKTTVVLILMSSTKEIVVGNVSSSSAQQICRVLGCEG